MKLVRPEFKIVQAIPYQQMLEIVERAYRICYASEPKGDAEKFIRSKMLLNHFTPLEHVSISIEFVYDRGVSHEKVRHRLAAFSQESTRYCNFSNDKFGKEITVVTPPFFNPNEEKKEMTFPVPSYKHINKHGLIDTVMMSGYQLNKFDVWFISCLYSEWAYLTLLDMGATPQEARSVLPNSLATKILVTANLREWRHIFNLRAIGTTGKPHPQMIEVMKPTLEQLRKDYPVFFEDLITN